MEYFWKAVAVLILTVIIGAAIAKTEKDISIILTVAACCMTVMTALKYLSDVIVFLSELSKGMEGQGSAIRTLLKISGVALITEITVLISTDSGNASLGKAMQFLGNAVILSLSLPVFEAFITMIQEILGIL